MSTDIADTTPPNDSDDNNDSDDDVSPFDNTDNIVIPLVILIIFILFVGWMLYLLIGSGFKSTQTERSVAMGETDSFKIVCASGQCATDLFSGYKSCPVTNSPMEIDPGQFVCNSPYVCDNPITPYALQSDGSTNLYGVCEPGVQCPCLRVSQCPEYILTVFNTSNGNPYQNIQGQRLTFPQTSSYVSVSGVTTNNPPIQYSNPAATFCSAAMSWLPLSSPGCNFIQDPNSMTYSDLLTCMGLPNGCSGATASPCLQGTLAIITSDPDSINQANLKNAQFGCVSGESCPCNYVNIFDTNYGGIVCRQLT